MVVGVFIYSIDRELEVRTALIINVGVQFIGAFMNHALAMRWNLEIDAPDLVWIIVTDLFLGIFTVAFFTLPLMSLFAKIVPERVEGTMFAFLEGALNFDQKVIKPMLGTFINV